MSSVRQRQANGRSSPASSASSSSGEAVSLSPNIFGTIFLTLLAAASVGIVATFPLTQKTLLLAVAWYFLGVFAEAAGYHRLWAHRSYEAALPLRLLLAIIGAGNFTGPISGWVRNHRAHHRQADTPRDPFNRSAGFFFAFLGHHFINKSKIGEASTADLEKDFVVTFQQTLYPLLALGYGWFLPALIASTWDDLIGGLVYAGIVRTFVFIVVHSFLWALGRTSGRRPYNPTYSARNNILVSLLTLGEGYLNFHYEFPSDYRIGCFYYHLDAVKWLLRFFSLFGLVSNLNKTPYAQILRVRIQKRQQELDEMMATVEFGPDPSTLPVWTYENFEKQVAAGAQILIIDNIVHDVSKFYDEHPGGAEVLKPKIGKDATIAFNGGVQRHSKAARNLAAFMRVAVLDTSREQRRHLEKKKPTSG